MISLRTPDGSPLTVLRRVFEHARHAVLITDADNRIVYANRQFEALSGLAGPDLLGRDPSVIRSGRHEDTFYAAMWQALESGGQWSGEIWNRHRDGSIHHSHLVIQRLDEPQGRLYVASYYPLTPRSRDHATDADLERAQCYDPLTKLPNRFLFRDRLRHEFEVANRHGVRTGLLLLNLDRFRRINDTFGFATGDALLVQLADRLTKAVRRTDLLARQNNERERDPDMVSHMGGNDFSCILSELNEPEHAAVVARRIYACLEEPFLVNDEEVYIHASIGIAVYPDNADTPDALIHCAERALQSAKEQGRDQYRFFAEETNRRSIARVRLETDMRRAIAEQSFELFYQPQVELTTGRAVGAEALIRWPLADGTTIPPADFIPFAEETNLILHLGEWVLRRACLDTLALNREAGVTRSVAVNLSGRQFYQPGLLDMVRRVLDETGIAPHLVELEITEGMVIPDIDRALRTMHALRAIGVTLAIDDFGTGYSSLSYLQNFPVNTLKIDRSFIRNLKTGNHDAAIVETVVRLGRNLGLNVLAEGVETKEQTEVLRAIGCTHAQGFHIAHPQPLARYRETLEYHHLAL